MQWKHQQISSFNWDLFFIICRKTTLFHNGHRDESTFWYGFLIYSRMLMTMKYVIGILRKNMKHLSRFGNRRFDEEFHIFILTQDLFWISNCLHHITNVKTKCLRRISWWLGKMCQLKFIWMVFWWFSNCRSCSWVTVHWNKSDILTLLRRIVDGSELLYLILWNNFEDEMIVVSTHLRSAVHSSAVWNSTAQETAG
jgi:hypothetical protein